MITKKKILLFTDWYEPGYKAGGPIQSSRNFAIAMQNDYDVFIVTSAYDLNETKPYQGIVTDEWVSQNGSIQIYYSDKNKISLSRIKQMLALIKPDFIYLNSMYSYRFTILPLLLKLFGRSNYKMIIAPRGMLQSGALQFKPLKKKLFLNIFNKLSLPKKITFHATDDQEKEDIIRYFPNANNIVVIPNFPKTALTEWKWIEKKPGELRCIFLSRIAQKKNLLFLLNILKSLDTNIKLTLTIGGDVEDENYWDKCLSVIKDLPSNISIMQKGPLPNNEVIGELQKNHFFILPTLGENFGHAIFEAFVAGKPVLISDKTPWNDLKKKKIGFDMPLKEAAV